jgi:hypothetical protein
MSTPQRFRKTAKAWTMLAEPATISRSVHALLLLANGRRSEQEISLLLGADVSRLAHGLLVQGYLQAAAPPLLDDDEAELNQPRAVNNVPARPRAVLTASA